MKTTIIRTTILLIFVAFLTSCSELVKKTIQKNPDIVFEAIKSDPARFMEIIQTAAREAQQKEMRAAQEKEKQAMEEEFKNPKKPDTGSHRAFLGESSASITIVEYSDFQCPFCQRGATTVERVMEEYKGKIRLLFKHLPLEQKHPNARRASQYFEAIAMQDAKKAYKFKKLVFENQNETYGESKKVEKLYKKLAKQVKSNMSKLASDLKSKATDIDKIIDLDKEEASKFGFNGTPGYLINGVSLKGAYPIESFKKVIDRHLSGK